MGIVEKLRRYAERYAMHEADKLLAIEAAEEIETLRFRLTYMEDRDTAGSVGTHSRNRERP